MTEKLYEQNAYVKEFTAKVLECKASDNFYKIVLDKTAFFPEGGGQAADKGVLADVEIFDVQIENENIYHYATKPLEIGGEVVGKINFDRRFNFMQNHTGEHIVSGIAHKLFGVNNVGFHLGEELVTIDFDKELTREQLDKIEYLANQKVWQNLPVKAYFPTEEELEKTEYRSKKAIDGAVRLVEITGTDICACCAPHVKNTGEIGIIKLLDTEKMRGGIRIILKCGNFALQDYRNKYQNVSQISALLSAKQENAYESVQKLDEKCTAASQKITELKKKIADITVLSATSEDNCIFVDDCDIKSLQLLADKLHKKFGGIRAVFSENTGNFSFAMCGENDELQEIFAKFKSQFTVRGGGRGGMVQGTVDATKENINLFFEF
ncbi:MAG: alanyl-tRNA editing protein [Ruminococcaceae bacterium]|nr:alanyl-tRNA editing protein [Oscillospiraceae bacterium]